MVSAEAECLHKTEAAARVSSRISSSMISSRTSAPPIYGSFLRASVHVLTQMMCDVVLFFSTEQLQRLKPCMSPSEGFRAHRPQQNSLIYRMLRRRRFLLQVVLSGPMWISIAIVSQSTIVDHCIS